MHSLTRLLTKRYLMQSTDTDSVSTMVYICFLGIFIGSFALTLVSAIMNGFEYSMHTKMQGIHANIIIRGYGDQLNIDALQKVLTEKFPEVAASSPSTIEHAIIQTPQSSTPTVTLIKAIDPIKEESVTLLTKAITHSLNNSHSLSFLLKNNQIIIGSELAEQLGVTIGDEIELLHADTGNTHGRTITLNATNAHISALFKTGIDECDSALIVTSFDFLTTLFPESGPTQLNLRLHHNAHELNVIKALTHELKLDIFSWKNLYPAIVSALTLEKYAMFFILILIMLVASMNIISLLFMHITQKRPDIAILKAMGTPDSTIERIFMYIGISITLSATIPGIALAALSSFALNHYRLITLPDAYYISYLPAHLEWHMIALVFTAVLAISFIAVKIAARKTRTINISHVLRFEG
ncbi:MAG: ABC transporter permease [Candidatus Dependentiae bacterium]|nr:ABC transporter permease [Candidatus Dependentiae bacterium]